MIETPRFKYVNEFRDRHGRSRRYFRRGGSPNIPLPGRPGSVEFLRAYTAALGDDPLAPWIGRKSRKSPVKEARNTQPLIGVYLLLKAGELIYVGQSSNLQSRVAQHKTNGREFDQAFFIKTKLGQRAALERALIRAFQPRQNIANQSGGARRAPKYVASDGAQCRDSGGALDLVE